MLLFWQCAIIFVLVANNYSNGNRSQNIVIYWEPKILGFGFWKWCMWRIFLPKCYIFHDDTNLAKNEEKFCSSCFTPILYSDWLRICTQRVDFGTLSVTNWHHKLLLYTSICSFQAMHWFYLEEKTKKIYLSLSTYV